MLKGIEIIKIIRIHMKEDLLNSTELCQSKHSINSIELCPGNN